MNLVDIYGSSRSSICIVIANPKYEKERERYQYALKLKRLVNNYTISTGIALVNDKND